MRFSLLTLVGLFWILMPGELHAQKLRLPKVHGMYGQWGYNRDRFSRSDIHFTGSDYAFTIHGATAHDRPAFHAIVEVPLQVTIPQNSFRVGLYLNAARTSTVEINFDHAKYVMDTSQRARVTGVIGGEPLDVDTVIRPTFVSFEHTNGANLFLINYVEQRPLLQSAKRTWLTGIWKIGGGFSIPKSDVALFEKRLDNRYHVAGYLFAAEAGARFYCTRRLFLEATAKGGWANFCDVLTVDGGRARHSFWFGEALAFVGYDLPFRRGGFKKVGE